MHLVQRNRALKSVLKMQLQKQPLLWTHPMYESTKNCQLGRITPEIPIICVMQDLHNLTRRKSSNLT